jgi:hypothetical protein
MLEEAARHNPVVLELGPWTRRADCDAFQLTLAGTAALIESPDGMTTIDRHDVEIQMPDFFPAVPLQLYLARPVFHPNVHPVTGFVCLWDRFSPGDSVLEALRRLQRVITWEVYNDDPNHVMQPKALQVERSRMPLPSMPLQCPEEVPSMITSGRRRARLTGFGNALTNDSDS